MSTDNNETVGPLKGLIVADFTQLAQGPWATQMLGDMGADIIKIEPKKGDWMRHYAYDNMYPEGESISFVSFNRNKRSIALNLKDTEDKKVVLDIIRKADILVENFRPGVMERLGLGYESIEVWCIAPVRVMGLTDPICIDQGRIYWHSQLVERQH